MLIGINANMTPDLLDCLMRMGHGDEIVVADANFPAASTAAHTHWGEVIQMPAMDAPAVIQLITGIMPPDEMGAVHEAAFTILTTAKPGNAKLGSIERQDFYARAQGAFAVVASVDPRAFGCFILRKGVIF